MYTCTAFVLLFVAIVVLTRGAPLRGAANKAAAQTEAQESTDRRCSSTLECLWDVNEGKDFFEVDILRTQQLQEVIDQAKSQNGLGVNEDQMAVDGQQEGVSEGAVATSQAMSGIETMKWQNAIVPYRLDPKLGSDLVQLVMDAINEWENATCIRFIPTDGTHVDSLLFHSAYSCSSFVGRIYGEQPIFMGGCTTESMVVHEIGHALGFWHEQSRPDRNKYVKILWENIRPGKEYNFFEFSSVDIESGGVVYDPYSIMQYSSYAFTSNGEPTIVMQDSNNLIHTADHLSVLDILQANIAYNCAELNCSAHSDSDSTSSNHSTIHNTTTRSFMIQNRASGECIGLQALTGEYTSSDPIDSIWAVTLHQCDPQTPSQYWAWSSEGSWIVNKVTGSCLSLSSTGVLVLSDCTGPPQYVLRLLCAGFFIEHPPTERCLSAVPSNLASIPQTVAAMAMGVQELERDLRNDVMMTSLNEAETGNLELKMWRCNVSNTLATWKIYMNNNSTTHDEPICDSRYQLDECYNQTTPNPEGWFRCDVHGYFLSQIHFHDDMSRMVSSITCCRSPYSYWGHVHNTILVDDTQVQITCRHVSRSIPNPNESVLKCREDEYLRGVWLNSGHMISPDRYYSLIDAVECCHPVRDQRVYRHCQTQGLGEGSHGCMDTGYFGTGLVEVVSDDGQCNKTMTCCV